MTEKGRGECDGISWAYHREKCLWNHGFSTRSHKSIGEAEKCYKHWRSKTLLSGPDIIAPRVLALALTSCRRAYR